MFDCVLLEGMKENAVNILECNIQDVVLKPWQSDGSAQTSPEGSMRHDSQSFVQLSDFMECSAVCFHQLVLHDVFLSSQIKTNQIVPEVTVDLRGAKIGWAPRDKSSKKNVVEVSWQLVAMKS